MKNKEEIYISTDIETDGPIPGEYSMLSLGSAAYTANKELIGTFTANFETLPNAISDPSTMEWWKTQPEAWEAHRKNIEKPEIIMTKYVSWIKSLSGKPVFVGYPAGFDFLFVYWYLIKFAGESPFSFSALDIKSYAAAVLKCPYREAVKKNMPKKWFDENITHSHIALDDAIEQGALFCNMLNSNINS